MKEEYETPEIAYVSFELSQNIAAGCSAITNTADNSCPITVPDFGVILTEAINCVITTPNPEDYVCYDVPNDYNGLHSS